MLNVFAMYDVKANYFRNPFMFRTKGEAIRGFSDLANDTNTEIGKHPEDFSLFHIAEYDEEKGRYINKTAPEQLALASEFVKPV